MAANGGPRTAAQVVHDLADAIEAADAERLGALYVEDASMRSPLADEPARGRAAIVAGEQALFDAFTEIAVETGPVLTAGSTVAAEVVIRATHTGPLDLGDGEPVAPTGRRIEVPSVWCLDVDEDGRIREERDYLDAAGFMRQLGLA